MISEQINELVSKEVERITQDKLVDFKVIKIARNQLQEKACKLQNENSNLKNELELFKNTEEFITNFTPLVTEENFESFVHSLNIEGTGIKVDGMNSERIPAWFRVMVQFYNHKPLVIKLLKLFNIKFPRWANTFKLPYDYNEEELDLFFENIRNASVTNSCNFSENMGFYYKSLASYEGDVARLLTGSDYFQIPWNLLLQNKLLTTDKYFNKILDELKDSAYSSKWEFFRIQEYQELSDRQVSQMLDKLPNVLYKEHTKFVSNNSDAFKIKPELVNRFLDEINDNQFSAFYYLNYPLEIQKIFIREYGSSGNYYGKFNLVKKMDISKEDKINFLSEIAELELEDSEL